MNDKKTMGDISAYFDEPTPVTVRTKSKVHEFLFHELSKEDFDALYRPVNEARGDQAAIDAANSKIVEEAIEKLVSSVDGEFFTIEQVRKLPASLIAKLGRKVIAFMSGKDPETAGEDEEKPALPEVDGDPEAPKD